MTLDELQAHAEALVVTAHHVDERLRVIVIVREDGVPNLTGFASSMSRQQTTDLLANALTRAMAGGGREISGEEAAQRVEAIPERLKGRQGP